jgi:predicted Zn-dependent protease
MIDKQSKLCRIIGALLGIMALGLYLFTLSRGPYPGISAFQLTQQLGLEPFGASSHIVWSLLVDGVTRLPIGGLILRLNLLSAVCGALAIWMFFHVVAETLLLVVTVDDSNRRTMGIASIVAGIAAALALMGAMPFWYVSNRFHVGSFDILWLMIVARLFVGFSREASVWKGLLFAFLFGLGAVGFATFIVLGPVVLIGVIGVLWYDGDLRWSRIFGLAGALLLGMLLYLGAAWQFKHGVEFVYAVDGNFWQALFFVLRSQYILIVRSLPQLGWLLVILVGIVPWVAVLLVGRQALNEEKDWGFFILHAILSAVVLTVLFNAPLAPWRLLGPYRLLVTPYVLLAFVFGYLTAYWFLLPRMWGKNAEPEEWGRIWWRDHGGWIPATLFLGLAVAAGVLNFPKADARSSGAIHEYAKSVVRSLAGRSWLVTDGQFDSNLLLAARDTGTPLHILNMRRGSNSTYMRYLAKDFVDPRLRSLAEVDAMAFLREWMVTDTNFCQTVALMTLPDLWLAGGFRPVPDRAVFIGARSITDADADALWASHSEFAASPFLKELIASRTRDSMIAPAAALILRQVSMAANNLGVILEDAGRRQEGYAAYARAREWDSGNISALLNQLTMIERGYAAPDADQVKAAFNEMTGALKNKLQIWSLSRYYGYVRLPEAFASLGMVWALSGEPGMAVAGFKRAIELSPERKDKLTQGLAMAYLAQDQTEAGAALYRELIEKDPNNVRALCALARLAARQNRFEEASSLLDRAAKAGLAKERVAMEYAVMHMAAGEPGKARVVLQELVELNPELAPAWAMLAGVVMQMGDAKALEQCERKLERVKGQDFLTMVVLGQIAISRADYLNARTRLDAALGLRPNTPVLLDLLLRVDVQEGRKDMAAQHIRTLLLIDPGHPFANQILASFQMERKEYALAESSLRKSLQRQRTPSVLNDLAWVLQERGDVAEAEALVREALKADEKQYNFWDTLGVILTRLGKYDEAEAALKKAVSLFADDSGMQVHLAELYEKKGDVRRAAMLAEDLLERAARLAPDDREALRQMVKRNSAQP